MRFGIELVKKGADPTIEVPYISPDSYYYVMKQLLSEIAGSRDTAGNVGYSVPCDEIGDIDRVLSEYRSADATIPLWYLIIQRISDIYNDRIDDRPNDEKELLELISNSVTSVPKNFFVRLAQTQNLRLFPSLPSDRKFILDMVGKGADLNALLPSGKTILKRMAEIGYNGNENESVERPWGKILDASLNDS